MELSNRNNYLGDYITITIGFDCNNDCVSCMLRGYKDKLKPVTFEEFKNLVKEKSKEYPGLILSGAEVTMNKDLLKFVSFAKDYFKNIRIQTNGRKLSELEYCKKLINAGVNEFYVSIYGSNSRIHDSITGMKGSFKETHNALFNLNKLGVRIITNTVVTKYNYKQLPKIVELISQFNNIKEIEFWNYWPMAKEDCHDIIPPIKKVIAKLSQACGIANKSYIFVCLKYFPECLLKKYSKYIDNHQPDTIIDESYWEKYRKNVFGNCIYKGACSSKGCMGFTLAYIHKFGWEENILNPIHVIEEKKKSSNCNKNDQIQKYNKHKKQFNIKNNKYLDLFEELLNKSDDFRLECSCKLEGRTIFPCRFNLWYNGKEHVKNINLAFDFLKKLSAQGADINYDLLKEIFEKKLNLNKIKEVIVGIDLRENCPNSRAKFWMTIDRKYCNLFKKVLDLHGVNRKVTELINKNELLFGFDFSFDGQTKIKIYPKFTKRELKNNSILTKIDKIFSQSIIHLISECGVLNVSFEGKEFDRVFHFHPNNLNGFLDKIHNKELNNLVNTIDSPISGCVISLKEEEINMGKIKNLNFYY